MHVIPARCPTHELKLKKRLRCRASFMPLTSGELSLLVSTRGRPDSTGRSSGCGLHAIADRVEVSDAIEAAVGGSEIGAVAATPLDDGDREVIALIAVAEVEDAGKAKDGPVNEF